MSQIHGSLTAEYVRLSPNHDFAEAINYILRRPGSLHSLPQLPRGLPHKQRRRMRPTLRAAKLFCKSDHGGQRVAVLDTVIQIACLDDVHPQAWVIYVLARIAEYPARRLGKLLPSRLDKLRRGFTW